MTVGSCNKQNVENMYLLNLNLDLVFRYEIFSLPDAVVFFVKFILCFWIILFSHFYAIFLPFFHDFSLHDLKVRV